MHHSKIGTSGARSVFRKFSKKEISPELFNVVFRNNPSKVVFGDVMSDSKNLKLSGDGYRKSLLKLSFRKRLRGVGCQKTQLEQSQGEIKTRSVECKLLKKSGGDR